MVKSIKIFTACHAPTPILQDGIHIAVQGGRYNYLNSENSKFDRQWFKLNTIGDDTGDNISKLNGYYNEMTILYWVWKNYEKIGNPDYVGFDHYRRHFIFDKWQRLNNERWTVDFPFFNKQYESNLKEENIQNYINKYDCLYTKAVTKISVYEQYKNSYMHDIKDLDFVLKYIKDKYPKIYDSAIKYVNGVNNYYCNMFILKKSLFFEYCEFTFDVLNKFFQQKDYSKSSYDEMRFYISERITGIFIQYLIDRKIKSCPLNCTFLQNTEIQKDITPYFKEKNVPVVFAVDDKYAKFLSVTLVSLIENSTLDYNYDLIILYSTLSSENKEKLEYICKNRKNVSLRFVDVTPYLANIDIKKLYIEIHVSLATYYRFFVSDIFKNYDKVIYLDSDLIINTDIAKLYEEDIENYLLGAAIDIRESIPVKLNMMVSKRYWKSYVKEVLGLEDPYKYFQAGVLIFNIKEFIRNKIKDKLFEKLIEVKRPILSDQDILNSVCYDKVYNFSVQWNVEWQIAFEFPEYKKVLWSKNYDEYSKALNNPFILHYASAIKPWNSKNLPKSYIWWSYAQKSPYFNEFSNEICEHYVDVKNDKYKKCTLKLFNFIPVLSYRRNNAYNIYKFFGIPVLKVKYLSNGITSKYYLFTIVPIFKKSKRTYK